MAWSLSGHYRKRPNADGVSGRHTGSAAEPKGQAGEAPGRPTLLRLAHGHPDEAPRNDVATRRG